MTRSLNDFLSPRNQPLPLWSVGQFPVLQAMLDWWHLAGNGAPPTAVDPLDLPRKALGYLSLLDLVPPADATFRLAGTVVCDLYGRELKGASLGDFFDRRDLSGVVEDFYETARTAEPTLKARNYVSINGKLCTYTRLLLPLSDPSGSVSRLLKAIEPHSLAEIASTLQQGPAGPRRAEG